MLNILSPELLVSSSPLLNIPFIKSEKFGKTMYLNVEIGRVFKAGDVRVNVKGQDTITVSAERIENTDNSKLNASINREFDLPDKIISKTLKAGLSGDGILEILALLQDSGLKGMSEQICIEVEENDPGNIKRNVHG